jgi:hypothetical protein
VFLSGNALGLMGARHLALVVDRSIALEELDVSGCLPSPPPPSAPISAHAAPRARDVLKSGAAAGARRCELGNEGVRVIAKALQVPGPDTRPPAALAVENLRPKPSGPRHAPARTPLPLRGGPARRAARPGTGGGATPRRGSGRGARDPLRPRPQENMTLEYIDLGDNGVSDDGAAHIASMLAVRSPPLRSRAAARA